MKWFATSTVIAWSLMAVALQNPNRLYQLKELSTVQIGVGPKRISAWLADSTSKRQEGMMFLTEQEVPQNGAMLFVFSDSMPRSFWMKNTLIALDLAYISDKGTVVNIKVGKPKDESSLPSIKAAKYVLEMKKGAFSRLGIKIGTQITIPVSVRSKD